MIALGAFFLGLAAATDDRRPGHPRGDLVSGLIWAGVLIAGLGVLFVFVNLALAIQRRHEDRKSPFDAVYDPDDPECAYREPPGVLQLRLRVTNNSAVGVDRVRVWVAPEHRHSYFLHIRHDNQYELSRRGEAMAVGQVEYFDLAFSNGAQWQIPYADAGICTWSPLPAPAQRLRLTVSGWRDARDVVPFVKDYDLTFGPAEQLNLVEIAQPTRWQRFRNFAGV